MDFQFSDEQRMLRDMAKGFLGETSTSAACRVAMSSTNGFDPEVWRRTCEEMAWQAIMLPEAADGLDLGVVELMIIQEAMGELLHCSPFFATSVAAIALRGCPASAARDSANQQILDGGILALAHTAARPSWHADGVEVKALQDNDGWTLDGLARFVPYGHAANTLLIVARTDEEQLGLFMVSADAAGLSCSRVPTMDQSRAMADVQLQSVRVSAENCLANDWADGLENTINVAQILNAADQVGGAQRCLDISVDYVQERVQFGRSIASFQAIKHKAADMMVKVESARSLLYFAACVADEFLLDAASSSELNEAAAMVAASAGDAYFFCAGTGIQLHGGVGITEEYDIQLYFKRARATESYLGRPAQHRETIASLLLDGD